jgi:hypothetical protein
MSRFCPPSARSQEVERDDDDEHAAQGDEHRRKCRVIERIAAGADAVGDERNARKRERADAAEEACDRPAEG